MRVVGELERKWGGAVKIAFWCKSRETGSEGVLNGRNE